VPAVSGLTRRTVDNPPSSSVIASLTIPQRPVQRAPESVMGTDFVLYVEDNDDLRELVVELVTVVLKRRCVGVGSYEELVALGEEVLGCSVAILDINLGPNRRSGIDAYAWLRDKGYTGPIVFLTGHASTHPLVVEAQRIGDAQIFSKPIDPDRLRSIIERKRQ
jgi:FixJ family two-component response regulator